MHLPPKLRGLAGTFVGLVLALPLMGVALPTPKAKAAAPMLVISEVNWAGSQRGPQDQWVELYNNTPQAIEFSSTPYSLYQGASELVTFSTGNVQPYRFILVSKEALGMDSTLNTDSSLVQSMVVPSLSLTAEFQLSIKNAQGEVVDMAGNGKSPLAGADGPVIASMSRLSYVADGTQASSWYTPQTVGKGFADGVVQFGTPGSANQEVAKPSNLQVVPMPSVGQPTITGNVVAQGNETLAHLVVAEFTRLSDGMVIKAAAGVQADTTFAIPAPNLDMGLYHITVYTQNPDSNPDTSVPATVVIAGSPQNVYVVNPANGMAPAVPVLDTYKTMVKESQVTLTGSVDINTALVVSVNGMYYSSEMLTGGQTRFSLPVQLLPNQLNKIEVRAQASDGTTSDPAIAMITQDSMAPELSGVMYAYDRAYAAAGSLESGIHLYFYTDAGLTNLAGSTVVAQDGSFSISKLPVVPYLYVVGMDEVGNASQVLMVKNSDLTNTSRGGTTVVPVVSGGIGGDTTGVDKQVATSEGSSNASSSSSNSSGSSSSISEPTSTPDETVNDTDTTDTGEVKSEDTTARNWTPWIILAVLIGLALLATAGYFYWFGTEEVAASASEPMATPPVTKRAKQEEVNVKVKKPGDKGKRW